MWAAFGAVPRVGERSDRSSARRGSARAGCSVGSVSVDRADRSVQAVPAGEQAVGGRPDGSPAEGYFEDKRGSVREGIAKPAAGQAAAGWAAAGWAAARAAAERARSRAAEGDSDTLLPAAADTRVVSGCSAARQAVRSPREPAALRIRTRLRDGTAYRG